MNLSKIEDLVEKWPWFGLIWIIIYSLFSIIRNPSFVIFSIIAITLSTLGIWIDFFPGETGSVAPVVTTENACVSESFIQRINKLSVFTFCIATLGALATDYVFEEKYLQEAPTAKNDLLAKHLGFLLWCICVGLAFLAMREIWAIFPALIATLILWMCVNIKTKKFQHINEQAKNNLNPDYSRHLSSDEFKGKGL